MKKRLLGFLFRRYYPELTQAVHETADYRARQALVREYELKLASVIRTHPEEKEWSSRFVALENDYHALEKDLGEARVEAMVAKAQVRKLLDLII